MTEADNYITQTHSAPLRQLSKCVTGLDIPSSSYRPSMEILWNPEPPSGEMKFGSLILNNIKYALSNTAYMQICD